MGKRTIEVCMEYKSKTKISLKVNTRWFCSKILPKITSQDNNPNSIFDRKIEEKMLSPKELANKLGCSLSYIKKLRKLGRIIPEINYPKFVRYRYTSVVASLRKYGGST